MFGKTKNNAPEVNYLDLTPKHVHGFEVNNDGLVDVLVPRFNNRFFEMILIPKGGSKYMKANLDEIGSATWLAIDGNNSVRDIIALIENKFAEKVSPARERVTIFLNQLHGNGFITFIEFIKRN
jgi:hypothetical protein